MDYNNLNYFMLILMMVLLSYNLYPKLIGKENFSNKEDFQSVTIASDSSKVKTLTKLDNEPGIFREFCKKVKYINNNFNDNARQLLTLKNAFHNKLNSHKKQSNELLQEIIDYQKKIINTEAELEIRERYEQQYSNKVAKQLDMVNNATKNFKSNYDSYKNPKIILVNDKQKNK
jgi:hypothetical protein